MDDQKRGVSWTAEKIEGGFHEKSRSRASQSTLRNPDSMG